MATTSRCLPSLFRSWSGVSGKSRSRYAGGLSSGERVTWNSSASTWYERDLIPHPDRTRPGQLAIALLDPHIIPVLAFASVGVPVLEFGGCVAWRRFVDVLAVADEVNGFDRPRAGHLHAN